MKKTTRSIRSESKASARSESSEPRQRSPMRSITPLESGSAICQSPSISCCAPESNSRQTANEPSEGVELIGIGGGEDRADALANDTFGSHFWLILGRQRLWQFVFTRC